MMKFSLPTLALLMAVTTPGTAAGDASASPFQFSDVTRVVAISDVHGAFDAMVSILQQSSTIDESGNWSGGDSHLVIVGDLLDRGPDSRKAMDLVRTLETQAQASGGGVHLVLGNHEVMNMIGDMRYVSAAEYAAFADDEAAEARQEGWLGYASFHNLDSADESALAKFDERFPAGYFALREAFSLDGTYGQWLIKKPVVLTINQTAFMHGGLSESAARTGFSKLNEMSRQQITDYLKEFDKLVAAGALPFASDFHERYEMLETGKAEVAAGTRTWSSETVQSATRLQDLQGAFVHSQQSPLWYRGNVGCGELIESDRLEDALESAGMTRLVVGHTPTPQRRVISRWGGELFEIDTGMLNSYYKGRASALILEGAQAAVVYQEEPSAVAPREQGRRVGLRSRGVDTAGLTLALAEGEIVSSDENERGEIRLKIRHSDIELSAALLPQSKRKGFYPEVAAYRLDQLLGLEMVPVTVIRQIDGEDREIQYAPPRTMDEAQRAQRGLGGSATCPLQDQIDTFYVFDTLIYNTPRAAHHILYSTDNWQLILVGHNRAFDAKRGKPSHLKPIELDITPGWRERLEALSDDVLAKELDGLLSKSRLKALYKRRDQLLKG